MQLHILGNFSSAEMISIGRGNVFEAGPQLLWKQAAAALQQMFSSWIPNTAAL